jgi:Ca2+-binding EF-hand superfamily protein
MDCSGVGSNGLLSLLKMGGKQKPPGDWDEATQRLIKDKDKDGNGTLSALEICISDEAFKKADTNGDGQLSSDELKANAQLIGAELAANGQQGPPPPPPDLDAATEQLIKNLDLDGNGTLSTDELGISKSVFDKADTNGDGQLSADELKANAQSIGPELDAREKALRQYLSIESGNDDKDTFSLTI